LAIPLRTLRNNFAAFAGKINRKEREGNREGRKGRFYAANVYETWEVSQTGLGLLKALSA